MNFSDASGLPSTYPNDLLWSTLWPLSNWTSDVSLTSNSVVEFRATDDGALSSTTTTATTVITTSPVSVIDRAASVVLCNFTEDPDCYYFPGDSRWLRHSTSVTVIYCVAYFTVFLVGILGNIFVVAVVLRSPRMRTVTNYFIVNLALADILVIILCLPATLLSNILIPWVLGWFMCKTVVYVQGMSVAASIYSLVAVSFDRFLAICYPLRCQLTRARAKIVIVVIWAVALVIPVPWAMYFDLEVISPYHPDMVICMEFWPSREIDNLYFGVCNLILCYILPLLIITHCYVMIWVRVSSRHIIGETKDGQMETMMQRSKVKVVKMLVVVVIIFMVSWLPLYVIFARMKFGKEPLPGGFEEQTIAIIAPVAQWLGSANSCINPILYAFFNKKFRKGFVDIVKSRRCCSQVGHKYDDELCSTFRRAEFQKSRQWRQDTQVEFISTSVL